MTNIEATGLAVVAVALFLLALAFMTGGEFTVAGLAFLGASAAIYFRETRT